MFRVFDQVARRNKKYLLTVILEPTLDKTTHDTMDAPGHVVSSMLLLLSLVVLTFAVNPGVKMQVTKKGIDYANTVAQAAIRQKLQTLTIPDQSGREGKLSWSLSNIQNRGITGPDTQIALNPANGGLTLSVSNFGAKLHADWRLVFKLLFTLRPKGSIDVDVSGVSLSVTVGLGEKDGRPSISSRACSCSIGHVGLDVHGGIVAFFLNLFKRAVENKVRNLLQDKVCDLVNDAINGAGDRELSKMKVNVDFARKFSLDYSLVDPPVVTSTYLEIKNKGEVYWKDNRTPSQISPSVIPSSEDVSRMLSVWVTDYAANTFTFVAHTNGFLKYNLTLNDIPGGLSALQSVSSELGAAITDQTVELSIRSTAPPKVKIENQNLTASIWADLDIVVRAPNEEPSYLTVSLNVSLTIQPYISTEKMYATIVGYSFNFDISKSDFGAIDVQEANNLLRQELDRTIAPGNNNFGNTGIDLPVAGSVKFYNTDLKLLPGVMEISTDVEKL